MKRGTLVIVPCGKRKIWDSSPSAGPTAARDTYTGAPFRVNRKFAERFGEAWVILSAKYGFIEPAFEIPGPYNVTFKRKKTGPISTDQLREQVRRRHLDHYATVIGLGGKEYRDAIEEAFEGTAIQLKFPFSGLKNGPMMQATNRAICANDPLFRFVTVLSSTRAADSPKPASHICQSLHNWLNSRPQFGFPYPRASIPRNGIYVLFESGELGHDTNRIVRIGTHTGNDQLRSRLDQHFLNEHKDRSIFRKNIGRCLLNRDDDPFLAWWELDLTTRAAKTEHQGKVDLVKQKQIEQQVSEYIRSHFRFVVLEIADKAKRLELESKLTSTISLCGDCGPSATWLGRCSPNPKIQSSGLWQVNKLYKVALSATELSELQQIP